jgi:hypothetical protein
LKVLTQFAVNFGIDCLHLFESILKVEIEAIKASLADTNSPVQDKSEEVQSCSISYLSR